MEKKIKVTVILIITAFIMTIVIANIFSSLFIQESVLYAFDDYSFLQEDTSNSRYTETEISDLGSIIKVSDLKIVNGNTFKLLSNDAYIEYDIADNYINKIDIKLNKPIEQDIDIRIYYSSHDTDFKENNSRIDTIKKGEEITTIEIPYKQISDIRVYFSGETNTEFEVSYIKIYESIINYFSFNHLLILESIFVVIFSITKGISKKVGF